MSTVFQPRIIIGSLVGFIATAIGVIAIFFPSLFNLESKNIESLEINLDDYDSYDKLCNFLYNNQEKIVYLNLTYKEHTYITPFIDKTKLYIDPNIDYSKLLLITDMDKDNFYYGVIYVDNNNNKYYYYDDKKNTVINMAFGENGSHFKILSEAIITKNSKNVSREKGSFSIWLNEDRPNVLNIVITESSNSGELYKWETINNNFIFNFNGYFFVNKIINFIEFDKYNKTGFKNIVLSKEWNSKFGDNKYVDIVKLMPISKKEIESKKYN